MKFYKSHSKLQYHKFELPFNGLQMDFLSINSVRFGATDSRSCHEEHKLEVGHFLKKSHCWVPGRWEASWACTNNNFLITEPSTKIT